MELRTSLLALNEELERDYGVIMPRRMQVEFSALVQRHMDAAEGEMTSQQLWALFETTYLAIDLDMAYHAHHLFEEGDRQGIELEMKGVELNYMPYRDFSIPDSYHLEFISGEAAIRDKPEVLKRFVAATQRGYEAASRVLTTIDSMLDQLINRTGLVGR